ncbi:peptidase T [Pedosphaera parvula]|uniref:Peptidase T n=1 Tax=Pedosphaera parvula (strain Ellin514) TaxID=320771 RepID=B9XS94_PEDPL|nr:peptidase T [Pedosphaera parvula]EEF57304.1 peptidase T [Pedosphaera parvula Ellin514]
MKSKFDSELEDRFVRYARIDTQSDEKSATSPSTEKQYNLLKLLVNELKSIGAQDVTLTDYGAVIASIPSTVKAEIPTIAFLAHVDTAPAFSGTGVKPIVHRNYNGSDIVLPDDQNAVLSPKRFPYLARKAGDDIITASGTTLLGADDKAGVAIVMTFARHLLQNPDLPHGPIRIGFTPDEEIGRGVHARLPADLGCDVAYTLDGGELGEIVYETFSADKAVVHIQGVSIHPGQAKDKLVNALHLAAKLINTMPQVTLTPETTADREGFIHVYQMSGTPAAADLGFILRDFELDGLRDHGELLKQVCTTVQATEPRARINCTITPQYRNMRYWLEEDMRPVELAREACDESGIKHFSSPTRGGTDGSRLTEMGVPTPNLFTGMQNIHGPLEWISVQNMARAVEMCVKLGELWSSPTSAAPTAIQGNRHRKGAADTAALVDWSG